MSCSITCHRAHNIFNDSQPTHAKMRPGAEPKFSEKLLTKRSGPFKKAGYSPECSLDLINRCVKHPVGINKEVLFFGVQNNL
jgi:hypothetical protein